MKYFYFYISVILFVMGFLIRFFLVDTDLAARFNETNQVFLNSSLIFLLAIFFSFIGSFYHFTFNILFTHTKIKTYSFGVLLIIPLVILFSIIPVFETYFSEKSSNSIWQNTIIGLSIITIFSTITWIGILLYHIIKALYLLIIKNAYRTQK